MSVEINQYLGYGILLPYQETRTLLDEIYDEENLEILFNEYHDSAYKKEIVEVDGCSMIVDSMSGKYIFFGKILDKSTQYEPLNTMVIPKVSSKIKKTIIEQYKKVFNKDDQIKLDMILLSHYR